MSASNMMNLNQLEHLVALDETRHFAKAADKVYLSQPAFSRSIQALERQTNLILFERKGGEIRPTPAGQFLIDRARQLILEARAVQRDIHLYKRGEVGELAFGMGPFPSATLARGVIENIRNQFPKVAVQTKIASPSELLAMLLRENIEFFVADTGDIGTAPYLKIEPLMRQYGFLYARREHPLASGTHTFEKAWEYGIASVKLPDPLKAGLGQLLPQSNRDLPQLALECDDVNLLHQLAVNTNTVVASTDLAAKPWLENKQLVMLDISDFPKLFSNISIVSLGNRVRSPVASYATAQFKQVVI
jgi:DNA-binding transcriptional LysR family regulator